MLAAYSGTKAFLSTFSSALGEEVKKDNITVEHVNTYFVVSCHSVTPQEPKMTRVMAIGLQALQNPQAVIDDP